MSTIATDTFTGTSGTDLSSHTANVGGAWTQKNAAQQSIQGNQLRGPSSGSSLSCVAATPPSADYVVEADVLNVTSGNFNYGGVLGRYDLTNGNGYAADFQDSTHTWSLKKSSSGSFSSLGTYVEAGFTSGTRRVQLSMAGTTIVLSVDGVVRITVTDATWAPKQKGGVTLTGGVNTAMLLDNFSMSDGGVAPGTHIVTGTGSFGIGGNEWLSTAIAGRPSRLSSGAANPPNWYHVGMLSWAGPGGTMVAYPVTRDLDLVRIPPAMSTVYYQFVSGVTATIVERTTP